MEQFLEGKKEHAQEHDSILDVIHNAQQKRTLEETAHSDQIPPYAWLLRWDRHQSMKRGASWLDSDTTTIGDEKSKSIKQQHHRTARNKLAESL